MFRSGPKTRVFRTSFHSLNFFFYFFNFNRGVLIEEPPLKMVLVMFYWAVFLKFGNRYFRFHGKNYNQTIEKSEAN